MTELQFRRLRRSDLETVASLLKSSFDESVRPYMTHCQHGIGEFLAVAVDVPDSAPGKRAYVGVIDETVVAYADFREVSPTDGFLSYICVDDRWRGRGIAGLLFAEFLREHPLIERLGLDVFANNSTARRLYARMGFSSESSSAWVARSVGTGRTSPSQAPTGVRGFEAAVASQRLYGFGSFEAEIEGTVFTIGILGESTVKLASLTEFSDDRLLSSLAHLLPSISTAFAIVPAVSADDLDEDVAIVVESMRQSCSVHPDMREGLLAGLGSTA